MTKLKEMKYDPQGLKDFLERNINDPAISKKSKKVYREELRKLKLNHNL